MHEYDVTLKKLLQASADSVLDQTLGGFHISRWLNVELLPLSHTQRVDLLGETNDGRLVHIELQSTNDPRMAVRMAEYAIRICDRFGRLPNQLVLYVGEQAMRMPDSLKGPDNKRPNLSFQYSLFDFRELDGAILLNSPIVEDNVLAVLARLRDQRLAVQEILARIADQDEPRRRDLIPNFLLLSGLRELEETARKEAEKMPILNSILDHKVIGPAILQGRREGLEEGRKEGRADILHRQLEKRFGPLPGWVDDKLASTSASELEDLAIRLLDAPNLHSLFER